MRRGPVHALVRPRVESLVLVALDVASEGALAPARPPDRLGGLVPGPARRVPALLAPPGQPGRLLVRGSSLRPVACAGAAALPGAAGLFAPHPVNHLRYSCPGHGALLGVHRTGQPMCCSPHRPFAPDKALHRGSGCAGPGRSRGRRWAPPAPGPVAPGGAPLLTVVNRYGVSTRRQDWVPSGADPEWDPTPESEAAVAAPVRLPSKSTAIVAQAAAVAVAAPAPAREESGGPRSPLQSERASRRAGEPAVFERRRHAPAGAPDTGELP